MRLPVWPTERCYDLTTPTPLAQALPSTACSFKSLASTGFATRALVSIYERWYICYK
jgi:hypothetical protein